MEETQLSQGVFDGYLGDLMSYSFFFGELCFLGAKLRLHLFYCRYQYEWKLEEAKKNILRTHTTAVSARMLYKLAQQVLFETIFIKTVNLINQANKLIFIDHSKRVCC